jgi:sulfite reductase alpha subunit
MVSNPRESSYVRTDDWDQEAQKWYERADEKKDTA